MAVELVGRWRMTPQPDAVWEVISDLHRWPEWWSAIKRAEDLGGAAADGTGRRVRMIFGTPLQDVAVEMRVVALQPPNLLAVQAPSGLFTGEGELRVGVAADGPTAVGFRFVVRAGLLLRPVEGALQRAAGGSGLDGAGGRLARLAGGELVGG